MQMACWRELPDHLRVYLKLISSALKTNLDANGSECEVAFLWRSDQLTLIVTLLLHICVIRDL